MNNKHATIQNNKTIHNHIKASKNVSKLHITKLKPYHHDTDCNISKENEMNKRFLNSNYCKPQHRKMSTHHDCI